MNGDGRPDASGRPLVSVVVAAYDSAPTILSCVDSILGQSYSPCELVVVDDGSTDATPELLERHPRRASFTVLRVANGGPSRARNLGVAQAGGDLLAFFDADCIADPGCVEALVAALDAPDVASAGGRQLSPADETPFGREVQRFFEAFGFVTGYVQGAGSGTIRDTPHNPSCNLLYRRSVLESLGGFDEGLWPGEDVDLDYRATRAGWRHRFQPAAVVYHYRPGDVRAFGRMMHAYGRAQGRLVRRYGPFRPLHHLARATPVVAAVLALALWRFPARLLAASLAIGGLAIVCLGRRGSRRPASTSFVVLALAGLFAWLAGWWTRGLRHERRERSHPSAS